MDFAPTERAATLRARVRAFVREVLEPLDGAWHAAARGAAGAGVCAPGTWPPPFLAELKARARAEGLWNLFLPGLRDDEPGTRLTNLEYAPLAEEMGRLPWASEVFNCSAPDTGNMELLHRFATPEQRARWLEPLLDGRIRSCFAMTEPEVASSDPTNLRAELAADGEGWRARGRKWFTSGAADPRCAVALFLGITSPDASPHERYGVGLVPMDAAGVRIVRNLPVFGHYSPEGHCEVVFDDVALDGGALLGAPGQGFRMAQARLGPGRVHHCMRTIGMAERALELMVARARTRTAFGKALGEHANVADGIAESRCELEQARLLVLKTAWLLDTAGARGARKEVAMIKVVVPRMATRIADRAIQVFGGAGLTDDTPLAAIYAWARALRIVDGPDEVHLRTLARDELGR